MVNQHTNTSKQHNTFLTMNPKFIKLVEEGNLIRVRLSLSNELLLDPRGDSFLKMKSFAESQLPDLYEPDNGKTYSKLTDSKPTDEWDKDFLFQVKNDLDNNFSESLLSDYERVAKKVLKEKAAHLEQEEAAEAQPYSTYQEERVHNYRTVAYTTTAVGATVAIAGMSLSKSTLASLGLSRMFLCSLGLVGVVIGGVLLYKELKK